LGMALVWVVDAFRVWFSTEVILKVTRKCMHDAYVAPRSQPSNLTYV